MQPLHDAVALGRDVQNIEDLHAEVRTRRPPEVDIVDRHDLLEVDTFRLQNPLLAGLTEARCLVELRLHLRAQHLNERRARQV